MPILIGTYNEGTPKKRNRQFVPYISRIKVVEVDRRNRLSVILYRHRRQVFRKMYPIQPPKYVPKTRLRTENTQSTKVISPGLVTQTEYF